MGGKHKKYVYVRREDGWYVKVRVLSLDKKEFKKHGKLPEDPSKYIPVGPKVKTPPQTYAVVPIEKLPEEAQRRVREF